MEVFLPCCAGVLEALPCGRRGANVRQGARDGGIGWGGGGLGSAGAGFHV